MQSTEDRLPLNGPGGEEAQQTSVPGWRQRAAGDAERRPGRATAVGRRPFGPEPGSGTASSIAAECWQQVPVNCAVRLADLRRRRRGGSSGNGWRILPVCRAFRSWLAARSTARPRNRDRVPGAAVPPDLDDAVPTFRICTCRAPVSLSSAVFDLRS